MPHVFEYAFPNHLRGVSYFVKNYVKAVFREIKRQNQNREAARKRDPPAEGGRIDQRKLTNKNICYRYSKVNKEKDKLPHISKFMLPN